MKTARLQNDIKILAASMGKVFRVAAIDTIQSHVDKEANNGHEAVSQQ